MPEDWSAIAGEVNEAIRSVADVSQPGGFPVALRLASSDPGENPWDVGAGNPTIVTLYAVESVRELRDVNGTLIGQTVRTLTCGAVPGIVPTKDHSVAVGVTADEAEAGAGAWEEIIEVRPLAPAGVPVLYEIDIAA